MEQLFTRMSLIIINKCNQSCPWCFEGRWKNEPISMMDLETVKRLIRWKNWNDGSIPILFLLGGEPTLHPKLIDIIEYVKGYNQKIRIALLTNLTCDLDLMQKLISRNVIFFINIDQYDEGNSSENYQRISRNLDYLNDNTKDNFYYNISSTVSSLVKSFDFAYNIIKRGKDKIYNFRIAPSCVGYEYNNVFQKNLDSSYYLKTLEVIQNSRKINKHLHFSSECATNGCMLSKNIQNELKTYDYNIRFECGIPEPNADILPDLSSHWCFAFHNNPELSIKNVFDYPDYGSMIKVLRNRYEICNLKYKRQCNYKNCNHSECQGYCIALRYYYANKNRGD